VKAGTLFILFTVMIDAMGIGLIVPVMPDLIREGGFTNEVQILYEYRELHGV